MVTILIIPFTAICICYLMEKKHFNEYFHAYLRLLVFTFTFLTIGFFLLYLNDSLSEYLLFKRLTNVYSISNILNLYLVHLQTKIPLIATLSICAPILFYLVKSNSLDRKFSIYLSTTLLLLSLSTVVCWSLFPELNGFHFFKYFRGDSLSVYLTSVMLCIVCLFLLRKSITYSEVVLFSVGALFPLVAQAGSLSGITTLYAGSLLLGLTATLLTRVGELYKGKIVLYCILTTLMFFTAYRIFKTITHCNCPDLSKYTACMHSGRLAGMYTTPQRAKNLESLVQKMGEHTRKGDRILAFPNIPLVHYISGTLPLGDCCWLDLFLMDEMNNKLDLISEMAPPKLIVKLKLKDIEDVEKQRLNIGWIINSASIKDLREKNIIFDRKILKRWPSKLIWSNDCFEIYLPEETHNRSDSLPSALSMAPFPYMSCCYKHFLESFKQSKADHKL